MTGKWHVLAVALVVGGTGVAHAVESYSSSGTNCMPVGDDWYTWASYYVQWASGAFEVTDQSEETEVIVNCPMIRRAPDTADITSVYVNIDDGNSGENTDCFIASCGANSITCSYSSSVSTSGTGEQTLSLGSVAGQGSGHAWVDCTLPDSDGNPSRVLSYRWTD